MAVGYKKITERFRFRNAFMLFLLPLPLLFAAIFAIAKDDLAGVMINGISYALYLVGALAVRQGLHNAAEYDRRKVARAPKYPLKKLGTVLVGIATGLTAAFGADYSLPIAVSFGLVATLGCYLVYGFDPRAPKKVADAYGLDTTEQVVAALESAERTINALELANRQIRNAEFNTRLRRITDAARQVVTMVEEDPQDLRRARKFFNVYLEGARQVTEGYARTHDSMQTPELENNFRRVLMNIEDVFKEQHVKLLEDDAQDLDVQIEVLKTQLKHEGVI
jgi:5-bromo-4-chloroindolyl phosphate hydrolysis protein